MGHRALGAALALLLLAGSAEASQSTVGAGGSVQAVRTCSQRFRILPYLTHVTATGIRINLIPEDAMTLRWSLSLGNTPVYGVLGQVTQAAAADTRTHGVAAPNPTFTGLTAGTQYKYLVECQAAAGGPWQIVQRAYFRTLRTNTADVYKMVVISDDHTTRAFMEQNCEDKNGLTPIVSDVVMGDRQVRRLEVTAKTIENIATSGADFMVNGGDSANLDTGSLQTAGCSAFVREDGTTPTLTLLEADNQAEGELRWEVFMRYWQPIGAFLPHFVLPGNHEAMWGYGTLIGCNNDAAHATNAVAAYQATFGNWNDAYPNGSDANNYDDDANGVGAETQTDGLYFEWASGSFRWFATDNQRYVADDCSGGACTDTAGIEALVRNAVPAIGAFVARTADTPAATFGACPSPLGPMSGADSYEDNATMGATQSGWLADRLAAKTETFSAIISHREVGGITTSQDYFYQRGAITTRDDNMDGKRSITESWDPDGDGDVQDEKYIFDLLSADNVQIRFVGHDHMHLICRRTGSGGPVDYISIGMPSCNGSDGCTNRWTFSFDYMAAHGLLTPGSLVNSFLALHDTYDCDDNGIDDYDPEITNNALNPKAFSNGGIGKATGALNKGYGLLTVNGTTNLTWNWVVTDMFDIERNNDRIITYGPILP